MLSSPITFFLIATVITIAVDSLIAIKVMDKNTSMGNTMGYTVICAAVVCITYSMSFLSSEYLYFSIWSSLYFIAIDWMLVFLLSFIREYTNYTFIGNTVIHKLVYGYAILETAMFLINPYHEISISYKPVASEYVNFVYDRMPIYNLHLIFTYALVAGSLILLVRKSLLVPKQYRKRFLSPVYGIIIVVMINAVFLYIPGLTLFSYLDVSVFTYSIVLLLTYWYAFVYSENSMLEGLSMTVFGNLDQGIMLFDYDGKLVLKNRRAESFFSPEVAMNDGLDIQDFFDKSGISIDTSSAEDSYSLQCYVSNGYSKNPVRCDYSCVRDRNGHLISYLLVFTDLEMETDLLTEFHNWEHFNHYATKNKDAFEYPMGVVAFDINNLGVINSTLGKEAGDRRLAELSNCIRDCFSNETYFVRREACLFALCYNADRDNMIYQAEQVISLYEGNIQYATAMTDRTAPEITSAIEEAFKALRTKKLLDRDSSRSQVLTSLLRALQESDGDTEAHVRRTQKMGREIGKRIGLNDSKLSDLSLLCLLHDIGKIGIPMEILNKPGKLTADEWRVLKSHTEKGYQIAMSSREFSHIADEILHHHERWDGKGYPSGLSRESIPLLSRIISVIDAYDAMVNDRPYRKGLPLAVAIEELKKCAGSQFDPHITSQFIQMLVEQEEITEEMAYESHPEIIDIHIKPNNTGKEEGPRIEKNSHPILFSRYRLDDEDNIIEVDDNFELITGYSREDVTGNRCKQYILIPEEDRSEYLILVQEQLAKHSLAYIEHRLLRKNGDIIYVFCYGRKYYDSAAMQSKSDILIARASDTYAMRTITEFEDSKALKRLEKWEDTYRRDSLTGLYNHLAFQNDVEQNLLRGESKVLLLMIDVDNFKEYNDTYGHRAGDEYLILVANTIKQALRRDDLACRIGGDEFACALFFDKKFTNEFMYQRAQQIFDKINLSLRSGRGYSSLSMGAVISNDKLNTFVKIYQAADEAMYASKNKGKGRLSIGD